MAQDSKPTPNQCPVCGGFEFGVQTGLWLFRSDLYTCRECGTRLRPNRLGESPGFCVVRPGEAYSNTQALFDRVTLHHDPAQTIELPVYTDQQLAHFAKGTLDDEFLTGEPSEELPVRIWKDEKVIFDLKNIYGWDSRPVAEQTAPRLTWFQVPSGGWFGVKRLIDPRRLDLLESLDAGRMLITTRRYIFLANKRQIDRPLVDIRGVFPYLDGIGISRVEKPRMEFYKGPYHWPLVGAVLTGLVCKNRCDEENGERAR